MDDLFSKFMSGDGTIFGLPLEMAALMVVLPIFIIMVVFNITSSRNDVRRRAAASGTDQSEGRNKQVGGAKSVDKLIAYVENNVIGGAKGAATGEVKLLRSKLIQAGYFDPKAVALYFIARIVSGIMFGIAGVFALPHLVGEAEGATFALYICGAAVVGYMAPSFMLDKLVDKRKTKNRMGFPDFMDLLVVCAEAGLSLEASIERVSRELSQSHPSLGENLAMVSLEIRAGRPLVDALQRLGERLGLEEAQTLATLLQQSSELGTSLTQSLKIYSDDMRNKRMSRAEEKAYALPAKLVVPLTLFVFPVLLATLLFPVAIKMSAANL
jgi:tight adherence protein C